jgi:2-iminobutanoate/2-iminopropanoate deaminase
MKTVYERLNALQIQLPEIPPAVVDGYVPLFVRFVRTGNLIYLSGRLAKKDGKPLSGKVGQEITTAEGRQAARDVAIELLATLHGALQDLNRVKRIVRLLVLVNSAPGFTEPHEVANELLATLHGALHDLNRVKRIVRLLVLVNSAPGFTEPQRGRQWRLRTFSGSLWRARRACPQRVWRGADPIRFLCGDRDDCRGFAFRQRMPVVKAPRIGLRGDKNMTDNNLNNTAVTQIPSKTAITSPELAPPVGPFSQAIKIDGFLFFSGQVAQDPATGKVVEGGIVPETERVFQNLSAVLKAASKSFDDVVRAGVFLTNMTDFAAMNGIYAKYFSQPFPARTTIAAAALPLGACVEIDLVVKA